MIPFTKNTLRLVIERLIDNVDAVVCLARPCHVEMGKKTAVFFYRYVQFCQMGQRTMACFLGDAHINSLKASFILILICTGIALENARADLLGPDRSDRKSVV